MSSVKKSDWGREKVKGTVNEKKSVFFNTLRK